jgi:hypothetical protein
MNILLKARTSCSQGVSPFKALHQGVTFYKRALHFRPGPLVHRQQHFPSSSARYRIEIGAMLSSRVGVVSYRILEVPDHLLRCTMMDATWIKKDDLARLKKMET